MQKKKKKYERIINEFMRILIKSKMKINRKIYIFHFCKYSNILFKDTEKIFYCFKFFKYYDVYENNDAFRGPNKFFSKAAFNTNISFV